MTYSHKTIDINRPLVDKCLLLKVLNDIENVNKYATENGRYTEDETIVYHTGESNAGKSIGRKG
jgi:hypothetical protein